MGLIRESLTGQYTPHSAPEGMPLGSVTALSISSWNGGPGPANLAIAEFAYRRAVELDVGVLAQWEIADTLKGMGTNAYSYLDLRIAPETPQERRYFNTTHVIDRVEAYKKPDEATVLVAQAFHAPRSDRLAGQAGVANELPEGLPDKWDPDSDYWWTRSARHWRAAQAVILTDFAVRGLVRRIISPSKPLNKQLGS